MTTTGPVWACTNGDGSVPISISFWQLGPEDVLIPVVLLFGAFVALPVLVAWSARRQAQHRPDAFSPRAESAQNRHSHVRRATLDFRWVVGGGLLPSLERVGRSV